MSDRLSFLGLLAVVLAVAGWFYFHDPTDERSPVSCTCRQLADNPAAYAGKPVRVDTAGCTPSGGSSLHWRRFADEAPAVVLRGAGPLPSPAPAHLLGLCRGPLSGGPVTVSDCRPCP